MYRGSNIPTKIAAAQLIDNQHHCVSALQHFFQLHLVVTPYIVRPLEYRKYRTIVRIYRVHYDAPCCLIVDLCISKWLFSCIAIFPSLLPLFLVLHLVVVCVLRRSGSIITSNRSNVFGPTARCVWLSNCAFLNNSLVYGRFSTTCSPLFLTFFNLLCSQPDNSLG